MRTVFDPRIVRAYDIRGTYGHDLFDHDAYLLAKKLVTHLKNNYPHTHHTVAIARDGRVSSPSLAKVLRETCINSGIDVLDIGVAPSPLAYFVSRTEKVDAAIVVTASHNPKEDNGFKILVKNKSIFSDELRHFSALPFDVKDVEDGEKGVCTAKDFGPLYMLHNLKCLDKVKQDLRIAWDFSHGSMAAVAPLVKEMLPGHHIFLNDMVDGTFPAHSPDPTIPSNLTQLRDAVLAHKCDLGIAFDGDGDRLGVVDHTGAFIEGDRITAILAEDVLKKHPGALILADIKSSRACLDHIASFGGKPELTRTGHSFIKAKLVETGALMAGEMSGHVFFADENYGYDDGLYAALRLIRLLNETQKSLHALNAFPYYPATPEVRIPCEGQRKFEIVEEMKSLLTIGKFSCRDDDGVRVENEDGFWLLRASNTADYLIFRAEGVDEEALQRQKDMFKHMYGEISSKAERS